MMFSELRAAFTFLTILPVGGGLLAQPGRAYAWFPLVGLTIGAAAGAAFALPLPPDAAAFVALVVWVALTGGLHLDGFGDSCDGLLATTTPERRLEIMRDPRAGSWAVVGLVLLLLGKWVLLRSIAPALVLVPPVMGRWAMVLAARYFPLARENGLGANFRNGLGNPQVYLATLTAVAVALTARWPAALLLVVVPLLVAVVGKWAARRLGGGLTGDVYGALCELTELVCLLALAVS
jgi:adenosylcobinamide-GDP ribazoletransferase